LNSSPERAIIRDPFAADEEGGKAYR
jgi:hypothetical protein